MGITLAIVGGVVIITVIAVIGDVITNIAKARPQEAQVGVEASLKALSDRVESLERHVAERDSRIAQLEGEVAFTTKLLEEKPR